MNGEYRVYDTEQKKYVTNDRMWFIATDGTLYYLKTENAGFVKARNCVIEWATGLTDRKVKKIFEGDIVKCYRYANGRDGELVFENLAVVWDDMDACFSLAEVGVGHISYRYNEYEMDDTHEFEVIGNIHDNPELLKNKNDNT